MRLISMLMLIIGVCLMGSCDAGVTKTKTTHTVSFVQDGPQAEQAVCYCSDPANCPCTADGRECLCLPLEARPLTTSFTQTTTTTVRSTARSKPNNGVATSMQLLLVGEKQTPLLVVARHPDIVTYSRPQKITTRTVVRAQSRR